jgi:hypothetical protein
VHGWLQAFGLYLESSFLSFSTPPPPPHPSLLFASTSPSFCFRNPPTASQKTLATKTTRHASTEKKPQLPLSPPA